ncbi:hypothetical protein MAR_021071 [Mya arenaria]|uniref:Uncharacterized protein n=1 Tax=Mya arenaria TaxID=6604 RepID=A0ABY7E9T7_MYAAR|nr:hypothetical protein MAR_021071 [Mya arenaria]
MIRLVKPKYQENEEAISNSRHTAALLIMFYVKSADTASHSIWTIWVVSSPGQLPSKPGHSLETEEYYSREAAGGDSEGKKETEGKTAALETASIVRKAEEYYSQEAAGGKLDREEGTK